MLNRIKIIDEEVQSSIEKDNTEIQNIDGSNIGIPIINIHQENLLFNLENNRTRILYAEEYCIKNGKNVDEEFKMDNVADEKLQQIQMGFLKQELDDDDDETKDLKRSYEASNWNQTESFLILPNGCVISGNRRLLLTRLTTKIDNIVRCRVLPEIYYDKWKDIEAKEEDVKTGKKVHSWINKGGTIHKYLEEGIQKDEIVKKLYLPTKQELNLLHKQFLVGRNILKKINKESNWSIIKDKKQVFQTAASKILQNEDLEEEITMALLMIIFSSSENKNESAIGYQDDHRLLSKCITRDALPIVQEFFLEDYKETNSENEENEDEFGNTNSVKGEKFDSQKFIDDITDDSSQINQINLENKLLDLTAKIKNKSEKVKESEIKKIALKEIKSAIRSLDVALSRANESDGEGIDGAIKRLGEKYNKIIDIFK